MKIEHLAGGRVLGDWVSATIVLGTMVNWLPAIASMLSIIWLMIQIVQSGFFPKLFRAVFGRRENRGGDDG